MRNPCDDRWMSPCIVQGNKVFKRILITANLSGFKAFGGHPSKLKHTVIREPY